jgi:hypothetical protein
MFDYKILFVYLTTATDRVKYTHELISIKKSRDIIQEIVVGSDPNGRIVRIVDGITNGYCSKLRTVDDYRIEYLNSFVDTIIYIIRPMNLCSIYFVRRTRPDYL